NSNPSSGSKSHCHDDDNNGDGENDRRKIAWSDSENCDDRPQCRAEGVDRRHSKQMHSTQKCDEYRGNSQSCCNDPKPRKKEVPIVTETVSPTNFIHFCRGYFAIPRYFRADLTKVFSKVRRRYDPQDLHFVALWIHAVPRALRDVERRSCS